MVLKNVLSGIEDLKAKGNLDIDIKGITHNSREVKEGYLFVAIKGFDSDGHKYVKSAIENGAIAVMVEELDKAELKEDVTVIVTKNSRADLAKVASNFYGNPASKLKLIGVTGTKGKTTVTFMIKAILEKQGLKTGLIGTVANYIGSENLGESERTTPDSLELQKLFARMVEEKVDVVVMEVSSQSLKLHRVDTISFDVGMFTNFSRDHISDREHPTMEDYFDSKLKLFYMSKVGYINIDDVNVAKLKKIDLPCEIRTYGIDNVADLIAEDITVTNSEVDFKVKIDGRKERVKTGIPGKFSVYNSLAAICARNSFWGR